MFNEVPREVLQSYELGRQLRTPWEARWQALLDLAMPYRTSFFQEKKEGRPPIAIYDETGLNAIEEMANRLQTGILPAGIEWARLDPAEGWDERSRRGLADVQTQMFRTLDRSTFADQANDSFKDLSGIGNCCLRIRPGDWMHPIRCTAVPIPDVWITPGPDGTWADIHVRYRMPLYAVRAQWPQATLPDELLRETRDNQRVTIIDSWIRNLDSSVEHWKNCVHWENKHTLFLQEERGQGSCDYVFARWASIAGEIYGVGQGMVALPAIQTVNEVRRQLLAMGELALAGMWQAEDDGVLNPWTIALEPGVIIPIAPNSRGLQPLAHPGAKIDLGLMEMQEQRQSIKKTLYNETLGPREGTPPTAFEVEQRMQELLRAIGPAYNRVWNEFCVPVVTRLRRVMVDRGDVVLPIIDGKKLRVVAASTMIRSQAIGEVQRVSQWAMGVANLFGPQALATLVPADRFAAWSATKFDVPPGLPYTAEEIQANAQNTGKMLAQVDEASGGGAKGGGGGGGTLPALIGALGKGG